MRLLKLVLVASLTAGTAQVATAQTQFQFLSGGNVTAYGYYVGPYRGAMGAINPTQLTLNCVDFFHHITVGQTWTANITNLGSSDLSRTRFASQFTNATTLYQQAAYLTTLYTPQRTNTEIAQIQATIWRLFDPNLSAGITPPSPGTNRWLNLAQANYHTINASHFSIITDVNAYRPNGADNIYSAQEFIAYNVTPEPATMILLGSGLAGLAAARRRKKQLAEQLRDDPVV